MWQVGWYSGLLVADVASAAITTTGTTSAIQPWLVAWVGAYANQFNVVVTAVSGTTPTLDVSIEESMDAGTNWQAIYHFKNYSRWYIPNSLIKSFGTRFRYVQTVAGYNSIIHASYQPCNVYRKYSNYSKLRWPFYCSHNIELNKPNLQYWRYW